MQPHAAALYTGGVATNIQIRSVDETLAAAAKAEAARRRMSLSDYMKELLIRDLDAVSAARRRADLYAEITRTAPRDVSREETRAALEQARQEMSLG